MIVIAGCSSSKKAANSSPPINLVNPPADKAVIYVMRPTTMGGLINFRLEVDGKPIGKTKGKQYLYAFVDPGTRTISSIAENTSELPIKIDAGERYFFEQEVKMGIIKARNELVRLDEVDAKIKLQKRKLPKDFVAPN